MVSVDRIQRGLSRYLNEQLIPHTQGAGRWAVTAIAAMAVNRLPVIVKEAAAKPGNKLLGVISEDGSSVDVEYLIESVRPAAKQCPATINIPMAGSITITEGDLDTLLRYMQ